MNGYVRSLIVLLQPCLVIVYQSQRARNLKVDIPCHQEK